MTHQAPAPEQYTAGRNVAAAFDECARCFEAFKDANDVRLAEIEPASRPTF